MDDSAAVLMENWLAIWQSEMAALPADRELQEWVAQSFWGFAREAAPRPAPAAAASDPRLDEVRELRERLAELERRVAELSGDAARRPEQRAAAE